MANNNNQRIVGGRIYTTNPAIPVIQSTIPVCAAGYTYSEILRTCVPVQFPSVTSITEGDIAGLLSYYAFNNPEAYKIALANQGVPVNSAFNSEQLSRYVIALNLSPNSNVRILGIRALANVPFNPNAKNWTTLPEIRQAIMMFENTHKSNTI